MNDQNISNLVIPNSVTNIENYAFYGCSGLTSVTIPDEVTRIGYAAFQNCSSLASVDIGKKVTNICAKAFERTQWFDNQSEGLVYAGNVAYACKGVIPNDIVIKEGTTAIAEYLF